MSSFQLTNSVTDQIKKAAQSYGACRTGIARLDRVPDYVAEAYSRWLASGHNASMEYMERHEAVRNDPRLLLDGAKSIIVCAFNYFPEKIRNKSLPYIALYAYGNDYHTVLRKRLRPLAGAISLITGATSRICIDTAPLHERYWAVQAGIGFTGRHSQLIVPGTGSYVFLASIITTAELEPDKPCRLQCPAECRRCIDACPGRAITTDSHINASRCISYLTIEHRGPFPDGTNTANCLYGCDMCQRVCPLNNCVSPTAISEFSPQDTILTLDADTIPDMSPDEFSTTFRNSAIKRAKLEGLRRNAALIISQRK